MSQAISFRLTKSEYASAVRLHSNRTNLTVMRLMTALAFNLFGLFIFLWLEIEVSTIWLTLLSASTSLFAIALISFFALPYSRFQREPKCRDKFVIQFSEQNLEIKNTHVDSKIQWNLYNKVLENKKVYVLVYAKDAFTIVPKRAFDSSEQEEIFRSILKRKIDSKLNLKGSSGEEETRLQIKEYKPTSLEPPDWR